jgi:hypothetical protein
MHADDGWLNGHYYCPTHKCCWTSGREAIDPGSDDVTPTAAEVIAAVQALKDERDALREQVEHLLKLIESPTS